MAWSYLDRRLGVFQMTAPMVKVMMLEMRLGPMEGCDGCDAIVDDRGAAALARVMRVVERAMMSRCDCLGF